MEILELMNDIAVLVACKSQTKYFTTNQRAVYYAALERVQKHGAKLFDEAVTQKDYEDLLLRVKHFELMNPSVVK